MKKLLYPTLLIITLSCTNPKIEENNLRIAETHLQTQPDSTLIYLEKITPSDLSTKKYIEYLLISLQAKHKIHQDISTDTLLLTYHHHFRKFPAQKAAWLHFYAGKIYQQQNKPHKAIREYTQSKKLHKNDPYLSAMLQFSQAELHMNKLEIKEAIPLFQSSAGTFKQIDKLFNASVCYNQIGNCYVIENKPDSIYTYYKKCFQYRDYWTPREEAKMLTNIALGYRLMNQSDIASTYLQEALLLPIDENDQAFIHYNLAKLHPSNSDMFLTHIHKAIDLLSLKKDNPRLMNQLYLSLADFHASKHNYEVALQNHRQYTHYLSEATIGKYDTTIKELSQENQIHQLKTENLELQLSRHRITIILLTLTFICGIGILYTIRRHKKHIEQLSEAKAKIETLKEMAVRSTEEKESLRHVVLEHFDLIKKVAVLEYTFSSRKEYKNLLKTFNQVIYQHDHVNWDVLYEKMNSMHGNQFNKIKNTFPQLKESEFKICCLTLAQFSSTEIAVILNYAIKSVHVKKSQIRKKLGISTMGSLTDFFNHHFQEK